MSATDAASWASGVCAAGQLFCIPRQRINTAAGRLFARIIDSAGKNSVIESRTTRQESVYQCHAKMRTSRRRIRNAILPLSFSCRHNNLIHDNAKFAWFSMAMNLAMSRLEEWLRSPPLRSPGARSRFKMV
jgi:hypothetical protein